MLTAADKRRIAETGLVPADRMAALAHALRALGDDAGAAAADHVDGPRSYAAAALRGKRAAYFEAMRMVEAVSLGRAMHPRSYSTARRLAREFAARRRAARG